jgi:SRSO17 transposase
LSTVERKHSWQLAEAAGLATPYRLQHLLGRSAWEADALRDEQLGRSPHRSWKKKTRC